MKKFVLLALDTQGNKIQRMLFAVSETDARRMIARQSLHILELRDTSSSFLLLHKKRRLPVPKLVFLFHQLAAMTTTGITFVRGWRLVMRDMPREFMTSMEAAARQMESGTEPSVAMEQSGIFPPLTYSIVRAGENSGSLDTMLQLLGDYYENDVKQKQDLINILVYPAFLLFCTFLMLAGAMIFILPVFEEMFQQMAVTLPTPTKCLLNIRHVLRDYVWLYLPAFFIISVALACTLRQKQYRIAAERYILQIRPIRNMYIIWCWQRFARILAVQLAGGIPILTALHDAAAVVPGVWFQGKVRHMAAYLENGMPFSRAVRAVHLNTAYIETMLTVGETTGNYDDVLQAIAAYYEWQMANMSKRFRKLLEPAMMIIVGAVIGFIVLCLLLPIFDATLSMVK